MKYFQNITWNATKVKKALQELKVYTPKLLIWCKKILNEYHGLNESKQYYNFLCGDWLLLFAHKLYAEYLNLKKSKNLNKKFFDNIRLIPFDDYDEFVKKIANSKDYNISIQRLITFFLLKQKIKIIYRTKKKQKCLRKQNNLLLCLKNYTHLQSKITKFIFYQINFFKLSFLQKAIFFVKMKSLVCNKSFNVGVPYQNQINSEWRLNQQKFKGLDFLSIAKNIMPILIPTCFVEAKDTVFQSGKLLKIPRPKIVMTSTGLYGSPVFKLLVSEWRKQGTKLYTQQHGGGYGLDYFHACEEFEKKVSDKFFYLGDQFKKNSQNSLPMPAGPMCNFLNFNKRFILVMCVDYPKYVYRIHFQPMPGTIQKMIRDTCTFLQKSNSVPNFLIKLYPLKYTLNFKDKILKANPHVSFCNERVKSEKLFKKAKLVVHTYLGTSWLETMALNIPTICFYDPKTYMFRPKAKKIIQKLFDVNILHSCPLSASRFIINLGSNIQTWWQQKNVQSTRKEFVKNYAFVTNDWQQAWQKMILKKV